MALVGGYTLDLYCDTGGDVFGSNCPNRPVTGSLFASFAGTNERDCLRQARRAGWLFKDNNTLSYCPKCSGKGVRT